MEGWNGACLERSRRIGGLEEWRIGNCSFFIFHCQLFIARTRLGLGRFELVGAWPVEFGLAALRGYSYHVRGMEPGITFAKVAKDKFTAIFT